MPWVDWSAFEHTQHMYRPHAGTVMGTVYSRRRPLSAQERAYCQRFLEGFNGIARKRDRPTPAQDVKPRGATRRGSNPGSADAALGPAQVKQALVEIKTQENQRTMQNQVMIEGTVKKISSQDNEKFFALVDVGLDKWVPVTAHAKEEKSEKDLMVNLQRFQEGDTITLKGYARPWSQKKDGSDWKNGLDIRITNLKPGSVPNRAPRTQTAQQRDAAPSGW